MVGTRPFTPTQGFSPRSRVELQNTLDKCIRVLPRCDCSIAGWDVSNVRDMSGMFQGARSFNGDISKWDVSSVVTMKNMFRNAGSFKQNLCGTRWVHSKAINTGMFLGSSGLISRKVCAGNYLVSREVCTRPRPAPEAASPNWAIISNTNLKREVADYLARYPKGDCSDCPQGAIGEWDVSRVTEMSGIFAGANMFNGDISKWDVSRVTDMNRMFMGASSFDVDLSKWDVSSVTDMTRMFTDARVFKGDISKWDVSSVKYMTEMFKGAMAFDTLDCLREQEDR